MKVSKNTIHVHTSQECVPQKEEHTNGVTESWHNVMKNIDHGNEKKNAGRRFSSEATFSIAGKTGPIHR